MDKDVVLKVEGISKKFCRNLKRSMVYGVRDIFDAVFGSPSKTGESLREDEFWAIDQISFELKKGEALGVIGPNGSGKSTLLRMIEGIFPPDQGKISVRGKVGALISVGAGFYPHMSGRENIFLNGSILGMKRAEIEKRYQSIIEFADIAEFIDAPVASYSSGMKVRLGFSIAIHAPIQLLLADEILAVGDVSFQKKCFEKIYELRRKGVAVLFVSHSLPILESMCEKGLVLFDGKQAYVGSIREATKAYVDHMDQKSSYALEGDQADKRKSVGVGNVTFSDVCVYQEDGDENESNIEYGKNIVIKFKYAFKEKNKDDYQLRLGFRTSEGRNIQKFYFHEKQHPDGNLYQNEKIIQLQEKGEGKVIIIGPKLFPQTLRLSISMKSLTMGVHEGGLYDAAIFRIVEPKDEKLYFEHGRMSITQFDYQIQI